MSTYRHYLPQAFPWIVNGDPDDMYQLIEYLIEDADHPGSSFAVTVDTNNRTWNLWLSEVSKGRLEEGVKLGPHAPLKTTTHFKGE